MSRASLLPASALLTRGGPDVAARLRQLPLVATAILGVFVIASVFAGVLAPADPYTSNLRLSLAPPFWQEGGSPAHPLGTDALGRDVLSRLILGARVSLTAALGAIILGAGLGSLLGLLAGYHGRWVDALVMRVTDGMQAFPVILLALLLAVVVGPSFSNVIAIIGLVLSARFARLVRGETLSWKTRDFVALARVAGAGSGRILRRHLLPNVLHTVVVLATLEVGHVILMEASLSFLGAGVPPPTPAWGSMVAEGREYLTTAWWVSVFPGLAIMLTVLALNLFGDRLRDLLDPKLRAL